MKIYEKLYDNSIKTTDSINTNVNILSFIIFGLYSAYFFMIENILKNNIGFLKIYGTTNIFLLNILMILTFLFLCITTYYFFKSFFNKNYKIMATSKEINEISDEKLQEYLKNQYINMRDDNEKNNIKRFDSIHKTKINIMFSVILLIISFIYYTIIFLI